MTDAFYSAAGSPIDDALRHKQAHLCYLRKVGQIGASINSLTAERDSYLLMPHAQNASTTGADND